MEILAPAGSISALKAAIKAGADAVYLGLGEHNARVKSNDFTIDNLENWVSYTHLFGVRVYVALNTAVKNSEMQRVVDLASVAVKSGADALIVADLGLAAILSDITDIPLHLSTQAGVQNSLDAQALSGLRIKRVILARETPIEEIAAIKKYVDEVEIFVQGAICVSFSGGCLLGSKIYGCSGNRGICNQACRLTYTARSEEGKVIKEGKLLSPYDLCLGEKVHELIPLGVDSVKIEGRLKRPIYVYSATKYYRDLLDGRDGKESFSELCKSFNRGFTEGYAVNKSLPIINTMTSSHIGVPVGSVLRITERKGYKFALVKSSYAFQKGDGAKILRDGVEVGGSDVTSVKMIGEHYEIPISAGVRIGDTVCLTTDASAEAKGNACENDLPLEMSIKGAAMEKLRICVKSGKYTVEVESDGVAVPSRSSDNAPIREKLVKVGGTDFALTRFDDFISEPVYLNPTELAKMRRAALEELKNRIVRANTPSYRFQGQKITLPMGRTPLAHKVVYEVEWISSADAYPTADAFVLVPKSLDRTALRLSLDAASGRPCYLRLPKILRECEINALRRILLVFPELGVYADNLYAVRLARELGRRYVAGFGLNVFNDKTVEQYHDADLVGASLEDPRCGDLAFVAGKVRLMSFAHCPFSVVYGTSCGNCGKSHDKLYYSCGEYRYLILRRETVSCDFTMLEDEVTHYPLPNKGFSRFYSFIGLNEKEKRAMMEYITEVCGE